MPPSDPTDEQPLLEPASADNLAPSSIGNLANLAEGQVLLPEFIEKRDGRLWVDADLLLDPRALVQFVDRVFAAGACLVGVEYDALCSLMYPREPAGAPPGRRPDKPVPIARDIRAIPAERQGLYKGIKIVDGGAGAEYLFEPVHIERSVEVPLYGEVDESGVAPVIGSETQTISEPAKLDADEFVAMMWQKGIRSGLDMSAIRRTLEASGVQRLDIAKRIDAQPGGDATLAEQTKALHRDDSPRVLPNGKIDLRQFKNRFPQITAGERLLKKIPRQFGQLGIDLSGAAIEPPLPQDYRLEDIAGPGTEVVRNAQGEFVVAVHDGFLTIDAQSGLISVTDKIVSREGVSLRTTGDLSLAGEEFEEHGEVQERRVVEGKNMTFFANVFGSIESSGGKVVLKANLAGGRIRDFGGEVHVEGRASQAVIEARDGEVVVGYAENSTIVAGKLRVGRAVACTLVAEEIDIEDASACAIAARRVHIGRSGERKDEDTQVSMAVPDFSNLDRALEERRKSLADLEAGRQQKEEQAQQLVGSPELKGFLALQARVASGKVSLTPAQEAQMAQATQRVAKPLQLLRAIKTEGQAIDEEIGAVEDEIAALEAQRKAAGADVACTIDGIDGATSVCSVSLPPGAPVYGSVGVGDLKFLLRDPKIPRTNLFRGEQGDFAWQFRPPAPPTVP